MALKIRLKRLGRTGSAFYHIVIADSKFAQNGRFLEKIGYYDPNSELSVIEFKTERALHWYKLGARPTTACAALFKAKKVDLAKLIQG